MCLTLENFSILFDNDSVLDALPEKQKKTHLIKTGYLVETKSLTMY